MFTQCWFHYFKEIARCIKSPTRYFRTLLFLLMASCFLFTTVYASSYTVKLRTTSDGTNDEEDIALVISGSKGPSVHFKKFLGDFLPNDTKIQTFSDSDVGDIYSITVGYYPDDDDSWSLRWVEIIKDGRPYLFDWGSSVTLKNSSHYYAQSAPEARSVSISGTLSFGQTLTGSYTYYDKDGDQRENPSYQWYRYDGVSNISITGANSNRYTLTHVDAGHTMRFRVIPRAHTGREYGNPGWANKGPVPQLSQSLTFGALTDKTYGDADFTVGATTTSGLTAVYSTTGNCSVSGNTVSITGAGACEVTASQPGNVNYSAATPISQGFLIAKAQAYITFDPPQKVYGDPPFSLDSYASGDSSMPVTFEGSNDVCTYAAGKVTIHNAGTCSITASQVGDDNYIAANSVIKDLLVDKKAQPITFATVPPQTYLDAPFSVSATGGGSGNPVTLASTTPTVCTGSGESPIDVTILTAGTCTIEANQTGTSNYYDAIPTPNNISIAKLPQAITDYVVPTDAKTYGDPPFTVSAASEHANNSGNPVTFSSATPTICTISGNNGEQINIVGAGTCTIVADQASDVNYTAAPSINQSIDIAKLEIIATADQKTRGYGELTNPPFTFSYPGLVNGDTASVIDTHPNGATVADANSVVGSYDITCSGGSDNNYIITSCTSGILNVVRAETNVAITSDNPDPSPPPQNVTFGFTVTPVSGNEPTGTVTVSDGQNSCTATLQTGDSGNGSCMTTLGGVGLKSVTATYMGDDRFNGSTSPAIEHQVDSVGIIIKESDNDTTVEEGGITDTYTIELTTVPTNSVTVTITPENQVAINGQGTGTPVNLTFTDNSHQTVTVAANDDSVLEGPHTSTLTHTATSSDADYNAITIASTTVNIKDNDPGVVIQQTEGSTDVIEGGLTDVYSVMLSTQPTDSVTVTISVNAESTVRPTTLTFNADATALNPQIVTVTAINDSAADGTQTSVISHTSASADSNYDGASTGFIVDGNLTNEMTVNVADNDVPGVSIVNRTPSYVFEGSAASVYAVVLNTQPLNTSVVAITLSTGSSPCSVTPSTLFFNTSNWNQAQPVSITPHDDDSFKENVTCTVRHTVTGGDYEGVGVETLTFSVTDNDPKPIIRFPITFSGEGKGTVYANDQRCHSDEKQCVFEFAYDQLVTLSAYPDSGYLFNEWTGSSFCQEEAFLVNSDMACTADFKLEKRYLVVESFHGTVTSIPSGIDNCGFLQGQCSASFEGQGQVKLTANPDPHWLFLAWEGACDDKGRVTLLTNTKCTALYKPKPATLDSLEVFDYETEIALDGSGLDMDTEAGQPITRKIALRNKHDMARMHLTDMHLPAGFSAVSTFPDHLEPGQTAIFQIQLDAQVENVYEGLWSFNVEQEVVGYPLIGVVHEACPEASEITTLYVKQKAATGDGGGCNWNSPFKDLQTALLAIANNKYPKINEVWVTSGTYKPTVGTDRTASFVLTEGVKIYGGFLGTEKQRKDRNEHLYECPAPTVLSGDIGVEGDPRDNSYHVVVAYGVSSDTGIYDVNIVDGNADGGNTRRRTREAVGVNYSAGGGLYTDNASLIVEDVLFAGNQAVSGGGMFNGNGSTPVVKNSAFAGNSAVNGGGMLNDNSSPAIVDVAFTQNQASNAGGGMVNQNNANPLLNNVIMNSNEANIGGGLVNDNSSPSITMSYFTNNMAVEGGGMVNRNNSSPMIDSSVLSENTATTIGGGMLNNHSQPVLMRSSVNDNTAPVGSGIANQAENRLLMGRSFVEENKDYTGAVATDQIVDLSSSVTTVNSSHVEGGWSGAGEDNRDDAFGISEFLALESPIYDIGSSTDNIADFNFARVAYDPNVKLSESEKVEEDNSDITTTLTEEEKILLTELEEEAACPNTPVVYVNANANTSGTGCSWQSPLTHLQVALATTSFPKIREIWVAKGIYKPTTGNARQASFQLREGVAIYGGFAGTETQRTERTLNANVTVLSGDIGVPMDSSDNSYHVVTGATTILSDVTISGGNANEGETCPNACGGGIYNDQSSLTLHNVSVKNNAAIYGGGLFNGNGSHAMIDNSVFEQNAAMNGGGLFNALSRPTLSHVFVKDNTATHKGGGMMNSQHSHARLNHVTFSGNKALWGGGLVNDSSDSIVTYGYFTDNQADYGGGMVNLNQSHPQLAHVVLAHNTATKVGGALFNQDSQLLLTQATVTENRSPTAGGIANDNSQIVVNNSILWKNGLGALPIINNATSQSVVNYSLVQGGWQGEANKDADPLLAADFQLTAHSPVIDAGDNNRVALACAEVECLGTVDLNAHSRLVDNNGDGIAQVDLGAYEFADLTLEGMPSSEQANSGARDKSESPTGLKMCPRSDAPVFNGNCNVGGQVILHTEVETGSSLSGAVIDKQLLNRGLISNSTVTKQGSIVGGTLSGRIENHGTIADINFVGASIIGSSQAGFGTLAGKIVNNSQVGGFFQDVNLAPNTAIHGGLLKGHIQGDVDKPATLTSIKIAEGSHISHVLLSQNVILAEGVIVGDGVWFELTTTPSLGSDRYGNPVLDTQAHFVIAAKEPLSSSNITFGKSIDMLVNITVDIAHQGQSAKLLFVQSTNAQDFKMRVGEAWMNWDTQLSHLQAMTSISQLPETIQLPITISPPIGNIDFYIGYQLENGMITHNGNKPIHFQVVNKRTNNTSAH